MQKLTHNRMREALLRLQHAGQWVLLYELQTELASIGLEEITLDENGYLFATLPANTDRDLPVIGFLAHVDTTTDYTGKKRQASANRQL